jgi:flagellar basal-body rod modification protein FlgD
MSSISPVGTSATNLQASNIGMQDFLNILLTQLTYQDPLKPMDNQEFMAQMAQFTTLGQTQELNEKIGSLLSTQSSMQSIGLIGRTVQFDTEAGPREGTVASLSWAGDVPQLTINATGGGSVTGISLSQITLVR